MTRGNSLADGKTDPPAGEFLRGMETLEHIENPFRGGGVQADTIVGDRDQPVVFSLFVTKPDQRGRMSMKLDRINQSDSETVE